MHTQDPTPNFGPADTDPDLKMIYLFGHRIPATQEIQWFGACGVCDVLHTCPTYGQALELVNVHAHTHYAAVV